MAVIQCQATPFDHSSRRLVGTMMYRQDVKDEHVDITYIHSAKVFLRRFRYSTPEHSRVDMET